MSIPVLSFFSNKGADWKTSFVYHLAWMLSDLGTTVVTLDLDAQANLTTAMLDESKLDRVWNVDGGAGTVYRAIAPLTEGGVVEEPRLESIAPGLYLVPGDVALASFEDTLAGTWFDSPGEGALRRHVSLLGSFWQVAQIAAVTVGADLAIVDVGSDLGAVTRSALIASDYVAIPLGADLSSLRCLETLGQALRSWRNGWRHRLDAAAQTGGSLPEGAMTPIGYLVQQHGFLLTRPVKARDEWFNRIPAEYHEHVLADSTRPAAPRDDPECLATLQHYRSLVPMGQEARKPIFHLTSADGAIGSHAQAVREAYKDFEQLARTLLERMQRHASSRA